MILLCFAGKMYVWLIIFVVPINALVNPILYTFTAPKNIKVLTLKNIFKNIYSSSGNLIKYYKINKFHNY